MCIDSVNVDLLDKPAIYPRLSPPLKLTSWNISLVQTSIQYVAAPGDTFCGGGILIEVPDGATRPERDDPVRGLRTRQTIWRPPAGGQPNPAADPPPSSN